jgi:hypothetical protein
MDRWFETNKLACLRAGQFCVLQGRDPDNLTSMLIAFQ